MPYGSPGAAASDAIQQFLLQQQMQKRQAMLDSLTQQRESRLAQSETQDMALRRDQLASLSEDRAQRAQDRVQMSQDRASALAEKATADRERKAEKDRTDFEKNVAGQYLPGDYVSPDDVAQAQRLGVRLPLNPDGQVQSKQPNALPGQIPDPGMVGPQEAQPPAGQPVAMGRTFMGTPIQRQAKQRDEDAARLLADPNTPEETKAFLRLRRVVEKGESVPAQAFTPPKSQQEQDIPVMRQNPRTGQVEQVGTAPAHAHFMTQPAPPQETGHYQIQPEINPANGMQTGRFFSFDTKGNKLQEVTMPATGGPAATKAGPGVGQLVVKEHAKEDARATLVHLDRDIDVADAHGLLGPTAGRIADLERWAGSSDPAANTLAARMIAAKMQVDAGIGGMRAAASPQLLARWDSIMSAKMTKENLHAATKVLKELVGDNSDGGGGAVPSVGSTFQGGKVLKVTPIQ